MASAPYLKVDPVPKTKKQDMPPAQGTIRGSRAEKTSEVRPSYRSPMDPIEPANFAHDFNNLLMIVHSCAQMILLQGADDEMIVKYAEEIARAVDRASVLTAQLQDLSRSQ